LSSGQQGFHAADSHRHQLHIDYMLYLKEEASASQASLYFYFILFLRESQLSEGDR
jgi:hypothetical protein